MENFKQLCESLGYKIWYLNEDIKLLKKVKGDIEIFNIGRYAYPKEVQEEYDKRRLIPADPYSLVEYWKDSGKDYLATQWNLKDGVANYAYFYRDGDKRKVSVNRHGPYWHGGLWFAGRRKSSTKSLNTHTSSELLNLDSAIKICKENGLLVYKPL